MVAPTINNSRFLYEDLSTRQASTNRNALLLSRLLETLASRLYLLELDILESMVPAAIATIWHCIFRAHPAPDQTWLLP